MKSIVLAPFTFIYPTIFFLFFLFARPLADIFSDVRFAGSMNVASILTFMLIVLYPLELLKRKKLRLENRKFVINVNIIFFILLLISSFSFIHSKNIPISLMDFARFFSILAVFNYAALYASTKERPLFLITVILFSALLPLCFGLYQYLSGTGGLATPGFNRIYGTFTHPNVFAQYLVLIFFLIIFLLTTCTMRKSYRFVLFCYVLITLFALYNTFTRGAWIALLVGVLLYISMKTKVHKKVIFVPLVLIVLLLLSPYLQKRWVDIAQHQQYDQQNSLEWRLHLWEETVGYLKEYPFTGNGLGMYEYKIGVMAHNDYLRISYETGFLGLGLYMILLCYILFSALRNLSKAKFLFEINSYKTAVCLMVSLLLMSLVDNLARSTVIMIYYFAGISFLFTFPRLQHREKEGTLQQGS